jgi:hypothetical protein
MAAKAQSHRERGDHKTWWRSRRIWRRSESGSIENTASVLSPRVKNGGARAQPRAEKRFSAPEASVQRIEARSQILTPEANGANKS